MPLLDAHEQVVAQLLFKCYVLQRISTAEGPTRAKPLLLQQQCQPMKSHNLGALNTRRDTWKPPSELCKDKLAWQCSADHV
jgi:hypothetical protein